MYSETSVPHEDESAFSKPTFSSIMWRWSEGRPKENRPLLSTREIIICFRIFVSCNKNKLNYRCLHIYTLHPFFCVLAQISLTCGRICCTWWAQLDSEGSHNSLNVRPSKSRFSTKLSLPENEMNLIILKSYNFLILFNLRFVFVRTKYTRTSLLHC